MKHKGLNGRVATAEDVESGAVVFYVPDGRSTRRRFHKELPLRARLLSDALDPLPADSAVTIVQAENTGSGDVLLGLQSGDSGGAVCLLTYIDLLDEPRIWPLPLR